MSSIGRRAACAGVVATLLQTVACRRSRGTSDTDRGNGTNGRTGTNDTSIATVKRHREALLHLAFTDAKTLTSASPDAACAWDVNARRLLWHVPLDRPFNPGETRPGMIPDFDDDAKLVAALERAGVTIHRADGSVQPIGASSALGNGRLVGLGPGGTSVVAALGDAVVVRRIADGATIFERSDLGSIRGRSRDRRLLALQDTRHAAPDKKLHVVDVTTGAVVSSADVIGGPIVFSDDGKDLVLGGDRALLVLDVATGQQRLRIPLPMESSDGRGQQPRPEDFSPLAFAKGTIVALHTRAELVTFDAATGQKRTFFPAPNTFSVPTGGTSFDFTPDARFAVALATDFLYRFDFSRSNLLEPRDITPPLPIGTFAGSLPLLRGATHVAIAPDGRHVAFGGSNGVFVIDAESMRNVAARLDPS